MHEAQIGQCLGAGVHAICEKPLVVAEAAEEVLAHVAPMKPLFTGQFQGFVDAVRSGGTFPITLDDAQASLELVTVWYRSARTCGGDAPAPTRASRPQLVAPTRPQLTRQFRQDDQLVGSQRRSVEEEP